MRIIYTLFVLIISVFFVTNKASFVHAQTCGGSVSCCVYQSNCGPPGCEQFPWSPPCVCQLECDPDTVENGVCFANGSGGCVATCFAKTIVESNCGWQSGDPCPGVNNDWCGGCIGACRNTATKTCTAWINEECSGSPAPSPGPGCTPNCSEQCGQSDGCGGNCGGGDTGQPGRPQFDVVTAGVNGGNYDATESIYFFRTNNDDGKITVAWTLSASKPSDLVEYRFYPSDLAGTATPDNTGGDTGCSHDYGKCDTVSSSTTSHTFRPRESRYYYMRLRQRSVCGTWSEWRERTFRIDGQISGMVLKDNNGSATADGPYGTCTDNAAANFSVAQYGAMSVTASGQGYTFSDNSVNDTTGRYRTYLPYQNIGNPAPGGVQISVSNIPAGWVYTCPVGGVYSTAAGSTIGAPLLTNGSAGNMLDADFYLCNSGSSLPVPINSTPVEGAAVPLSGATVPITWQAGVGSIGTEEYDLQVIAAANEAGVVDESSHCALLGSACPASQAGLSYNFTPSNNIYQYAYRLRSNIAACGGVGGAWSPWIHFTVTATITGNFYLDPTNAAVVGGSGICTLGGASANSAGTGASLNATGADSNVYAGTFGANNYSVTVPFWSPTGNNQVTLTPGTDGAGQLYTCTCPVGCTYSGIDSPGAGVNFFLQENNLVNSGWFQTRGANVYAANSSGPALRSYVPVAYCTSGVGCIPYVLATDLAAGVDTAGIMMTGGGTVDTTSDPGDSGTQITERATQVAAIGTSNNRVFENYDFYYRQFSLGTAPVDDFSSSANDALKPSSPPTDGKRAYFHSGNLIIQNQWVVDADEKITVIVDGDLNLRNTTLGNNVAPVDQLISVAPGGYLAFVVSGDIIVESSVGNTTISDITTSNIEGVYVADGVLTIQSIGAAGDNTFVGAGTFVGWGGVDLQRDFDDGGLRKAENNTKAVENFIFRPDFVLNIPEEISRSSYIWKETN